MEAISIRSDVTETISVSIVDQFSSTPINIQENVDTLTLRLMLKADYVTIGKNTLKKQSTRVDEFGNVFFYGTEIEIENI